MSLPKTLRRQAAAAGMATPPAPVCRCSHPKSRHTRGQGMCWVGPCGCNSYEKRVTA